MGPARQGKLRVIEFMTPICFRKKKLCAKDHESLLSKTDRKIDIRQNDLVGKKTKDIISLYGQKN